MVKKGQSYYPDPLRSHLSRVFSPWDSAPMTLDDLTGFLLTGWHCVGWHFVSAQLFMLKSRIWTSRVFFFFLFSKISVQPFLPPPPTSSPSQCSRTLFSQILLSWSPTKQFSYSLRNKKCIANKYFCMKTIAHNGNRTSIKGDRSIIFQTDLLCL